MATNTTTTRRASGRRTVRGRLALILILLALIPVAFVDLFALVRLRTSTIDNVSATVENQARTPAVELSTELANQLELLVALSENNNIGNSAERNSIRYEGTDAEIEENLITYDEIWQAFEDTNLDVLAILQASEAIELEQYRRNHPQNAEIFFTDNRGALIAATNRTSDYYQADEAWWQAAYNGGEGAVYIQPAPVFDESSQTYGLIIAVPIYNTNDELFGILRTTYDLTAFAQTLSDGAFGDTGRLYLTAADGTVIGAADLQNDIGVELTGVGNLIGAGEFEETSEAFAEEEQLSEFPLINDEQGTDSVVSIVRVGTRSNTTYADQVNSLDWYMVSLINLEEAQQPINRAATLLIVLLAGVVAGGVVAGTFLARSFTQPLVALTEGARRISEEDDFSTRVQVTTEDEFGELGDAFNTMASEIESMITGLEDRVAERTRDLELASEVSQQISQTLSLDEVLPKVAELTKENFDLYHAHVYLLDDSDMLIMEAGAGEPGRVMKEQGHRIPLNAERSLVARAARTGEPVAVDDVTREPGFLPNPLLPNTRSELAVPLRVEDEVLGVLDVQADEPEYFTAENILVMSTLAGQVAVAVRNARTFANLQLAQQQARDALDNLARQSRFSAAVARVATTLLNLGIGGLPDSLKLLGEAADASRVRFFRVRKTDESAGLAEMEQEWVAPGIDPFIKKASANKLDFANHYGMWYRTLADGDPIQTMASTETGEYEKGLMLEQDVKSLLQIPIFVETEFYGFLSFHECRYDRRWEPAEIELLQTAAISVAYTITGRQLLVRTQAALLQVETLYDIAKRLNQLDDPQDLLQTYADPVLKDVPGTATLHLVASDSDGNPVMFELGAKFSNRRPSFDEAVGTQTPVKDFRLYELTAEKLEAIQSFSDVKNDDRISSKLEKYLSKHGIEAMTLVPLVPVGKRWVGLVALLWPEPTTLSRDQEQMLELLAPQLANVLENKRSLQETQQALERLDLLVGALPNLIFIFDEERRYQEIYTPDPSILVAPAEELLGKPYADFIPDFISKQIDDAIDTIKETGEPVTFPYSLDIGEVTLHFEGIVSPIEETSSVLMTINEVTERVVREQRQVISYALVRELNAIDNPDDLLDLVVTTLGDEYKYYHAHIYLYDDADGGVLSVAEGLGEAGNMLKKRKHSIPMDAERSLVAQAARTREAVVVNNVEENPDHLPNPLLPLTKSEVAIPMIAGDALLGVLDIQHDQKEFFSDEQVRTLGTIANQVAISLANLRSTAEIKETLARLDLVVASMPGIIFVFDDQGRYAEIYTPDPGLLIAPAEELIGKKYADFIPDFITMAIDEAAGVARKTGEAVTFPYQLEIEGNPIYFEGTIAPVRGSTNVIMTVNEVTERINREMRQVAGYELVRQMNSLLDPEDLLVVTVETLGDQFNYYHANIYLFDEDNEALQVARGLGKPGETLVERKHSMPLDAERSFVAQAARVREAVVANDVQATEDHLPNPLLPMTKSEVAIPMLAGERLLGVLDVQHNQKDYFDDEQVRDLGTIANQLAISLENARLLDNVQTALTEAAQSEQLIRSVIDNSSDWIWLKDKDFRFVIVNETMTSQAFGVPVAGVIGKDDYDFFPAELVDGDPERGIEGFRAADQKVLKTGEVEYIPYEIVMHVDGTEHILETRKVPFRDESGKITGILGSARDITESFRANQRQQTAYELGQELASSLDTEFLLERTVTRLGEAFEYYHAHVYLFDPEQDLLVVREGLGLAGEQLKKREHSIPLAAEQSVVARAARTLEPVLVNDVTIDPSHLPNPLLPETRSEVAVPIETGGKLVGVLDVQHDRADHFTQNEMQMLGVIANQLGVALENARLIDELQLRQAAIESSTIGVSIVDMRTEDQPLNYVNDAFVNITGYSREEVIGNNCRFLQADDRDQEALDEVRAALKEGRETTVLLRNYRKDGTLFYNELSLSPIYNRVGTLTHFVGLQYDITDRIRQTERERLARDLAEQLPTLLNPEELLAVTVNRLGETFDYYHAHIYMLEDNLLQVKEGLGSAGAQLKERRHTIPLDAERSVVARAARNNESIVVDDVTADSSYLPNPLLPRTRAEAAIPIALGERVMGILDIQENVPGAFNEQEVQTLEIIASQLAVALSNASLFAETERSLAATEALYRAGTAISEASSIEGILEAVVENSDIPEYIDYANIVMFDESVGFDQKPGDAEVHAVWKRDPGSSDVQSPVGTRLNKGGGLADLADQPYVICNDIATDDRFDAKTRKLLQDAGFTSWFIIFLRDAARRWMGWLSFVSSSPAEIDELTVRFFRALGDQAATAMSNQVLLDRIQSALVETAESEQLIRSVVNNSVDWISLKDLDHRYLIVNDAMATQMFDMATEEITGKRDEELVPVFAEEEIYYSEEQRVIETGEILFNSHEVVLFADGSQHIMETRKIPVRDRVGNIIGVLATSRDVTDRERVARRQATAYELARQLTTSLEVGNLLTETVERVANAFNYYHAHVYLFNPEKAILTVEEGLGEAGMQMKERGHSIPLGAERSLVARAGRTLEPVVANDVKADPFHLPNPLLPETASEVAVPLALGEDLLGVLDVQQDQANYFTEDEVRTLSIIANQLAIALSNADLYREQLETAEKLREVDQLKSEFLANMSHELRTPLNSIIGYSELLIDEMEGDLDELAMEDIKAIHSSGHHLLAIINDVLDLAKIEAGRMELNRSMVDVSGTIPQIVDMLRVQLRDKPDVDLKVEVQEDLPQINADPVRMRQIVWNLLSNAIKFTEKGYVRVGVNTVNDRWLRIEVEDTGAGIPDHQRDLVFDQFRQADGSATRKAGGTGLGLAITRQLARLHGGDVWLDSSEIGAGSTFVFTLPIEEESPVPDTGNLEQPNGRATNGHVQNEETEETSGD